jgi:hypothetical protein
MRRSNYAGIERRSYAKGTRMPQLEFDRLGGVLKRGSHQLHSGVPIDLRQSKKVVWGEILAG